MYQVFFNQTKVISDPAGGGSDDWAKAIGIPYVYTIELRPVEPRFAILNLSFYFYNFKILEFTVRIILDVKKGS